VLPQHTRVLQPLIQAISKVLLHPSSSRPLRAITALPARRLSKLQILVLLIAISVGVFARTWEFGRLPPSLNPDEVSSAVEARSLFLYGQDRNAVSYPVKFISWGSGQDVLYAYLLIPLGAIFGFRPLIVRLPMLLLGLAALPLTYLAARRLFDEHVALVSTVMLAISPWHILLSRWALDANLLPVVFLAGFFCLLRVRDNAWWFVPGCALVAVCLYAYGTAYLFIPVFAAGATIVLARAGLVSRGPLVSGLAVLVFLGAPIALLIAQNALGGETISLGPVTVPRFPVDARWQSTTLFGAASPALALRDNAAAALRVLALETDSIPYNVVEPFGYFYRCGLVLAILGIVLVARRHATTPERHLLFLWIGAAALVPLLQQTNINRANILFLPLLLFGAYPVTKVAGLHRWAAAALAILALAAFASFTAVYHGTSNRAAMAVKFQEGIIPALQYAKTAESSLICVTNRINMPYIYALYVDPIPPRNFLASVRYVDPSEPLRRVASFGRYAFGTAGCDSVASSVYVLTSDEIPPRLGNRYSYRFFDNFVVYYPKR